MDMVLMILQIVVVIATAVFASVLTFVLNHRFGWGVVRSSALPSLMLALVVRFTGMSEVYRWEQLSVVFYGATFVGMVSSSVISSLTRVGFAGAIYAIIFLHSSLFFKGFGGALGVTAAIAVVVTLCLPLLFFNKRTTIGMLVLRKLVIRKRNSHAHSVRFLLKHRKKLRGNSADR